MSTQTKLQPFVCLPEDPFAAEHAAIGRWAEQAAASPHAFDLTTIESGRTILSAKPDDARKYVRATIIQAHHWDTMLARIRAEGRTSYERDVAHWHPDYGEIWGNRRQAVAAMTPLLRRALPLTREDIVALVTWCNGIRQLSPFREPLAYIVQALKRFASGDPVDAELRELLKQFAAQLRSSYDKKANRLGTIVEHLSLGAADDVDDVLASVAIQRDPPPIPALAGNLHVLQPLKHFVGMFADTDLSPTTLIGQDGYPYVDGSPLVAEHELLNLLLEEVAASEDYFSPELAKLPSGRIVIAMDAPSKGKLLLAVAERHMNALLGVADPNDRRLLGARCAADGIADALLDSNFEVDHNGLFDLLLYLAIRPVQGPAEFAETTVRLICQTESETLRSPLTEGERYVLFCLRASLVAGPLFGASTDEISRLTHLINDGASFFLVPHEWWTDALNSDLSSCDAVQQQKWTDLLTHAAMAKSSRPSAKWLSTAQQCVEAIGAEQVCQALMRWLPLVSRARTIRELGPYVGDKGGGNQGMNQENATCLRGLLWLTPLLPEQKDLARVIVGVTLSAYKKVPGIGPRAPKVGNAAVYALSQIASRDAVGQLAMLKVQVKFGTAQKEIEKAFNAAAAALNLPREQIEELGVPSYGLEEVGRCSEAVGEYRAELVVNGSDAALSWFDAQGKALKSVPAKVKREHKDELKDLQQSLKDIQSMLPAQRDRIDSMFLQQKSWPFAVWQERYLDHPLVGTIARRLMWCVDGTPAFFSDGKATDLQGEMVKHGETAEMTLWHPVGRAIDEVVAWRRRLEELGVTQPFKQAHREVYLLTDAERRTNTYSNRFAAHVLRQHQFNALCATRGWKNKLRLMVDDTYPPASKELPAWGLRAEYWIEGIGDDFGRDTNESGVYLRGSTDQVRFYRIEAAETYAHAAGGGYALRAAGPGAERVNEPLPLEEVPPLVFSCFGSA